MWECVCCVAAFTNHSLVGCAHHTVSHLPFLIGENIEKEEYLDVWVDFNAQVYILRSKQDMWQQDQKLVMIFNILLSQHLITLLNVDIFLQCSWHGSSDIVWHVILKHGLSQC